VAGTRIVYSRTEKCSNASLIVPERVYLPLLHIKLGRKKTFVKAMDQNSAGFMYLKNKLPRIRDAKNQRPQIPALIQDIKFENQRSEVENAAWKSFKNVTSIFWGNHKAENYHHM
jgi:hypothetical protein